MALRHGTLALLVALLAGCNGSGSRGGNVDLGGDGGDGGGDSDADGDSDTAGGCSEESKLVYVVDLDNTLYRFDPPNKTFIKAGVIDCPSSGAPYALGMSRVGVVYVLYTNGGTCTALNRVDITNGACLGPTDFVCGDQGFEAFGMGSATDGPGSTVDTLYVGSDSMLASLDTTTWQLTAIGPVASTPDMSGNANGDLFAYFAWVSPPRVSRLDKATAQELDTVELPQLSSAGAFAFATYDGDGYLFFDGNGSSTTVYRLHEGVLETYMENTGLTIVGADTSTCAPAGVE